jgi:hypothetical protein
MKKFKVTYKPTPQRIFIVEAENIPQAITRAEMRRKEQFDALANEVSAIEYKEPQKVI